MNTPAKRVAQAPSPAPQPAAKPVKSEYRRNLPHIQKEGGTYFVTFVTHGRWHIPEALRAAVLAHCLHDHGTKVWIHGAVVMRDHVHLVLSPMADDAGGFYGLAEILQAIKGASSHTINRAHTRKGRVWQVESFDHLLRSDEGAREKVEYLCQNPVRAGLVASEDHYPWLWREWVEGAGEGACATPSES